MALSSSSTWARHCQQASRWLRTWRALRPANSPSRWRNSRPSSGWRTSRLLIAHLLEPHHRAPQEFPHRARADSQRTADLRIPQTFHAQKQAAPLLFAQTLHGGMKARHPFAFQELTFRRVRLGGVAVANLGIEGLLGMLPGTDFEAQIVRHAEDPGARVLNLFPLALRGIQAQKNFLRGFLCLRRIQTQSQQIPVNIVPRRFEQTGDLILERCTGLFLAYQTHELFVGRE